MENITVVERQDIEVKSLAVRTKKLISKHKLPFYTVVLPTLLSIIYFGFIASDVYISESQYIVRSSKQQTPNPLGFMFGANFGSAMSESHNVSAFMLSRDALQKLNLDKKFETEFTDKKIDIFNRYGTFRLNKSFESLHSYYQHYVSVYFDAVTGISTLKVRGYSPKVAKEVNSELLEMAEVHINLLNERARQDMIRFAKSELSLAEKSATEATIKLMDYRKQNKVFNPAEFERLVVEKGFTLEQMKIRRAALESAITDAMRQILYLERIVHPNEPDYPIEPLRIRNIFSTFILGLILWGILGMLSAGVREHHD